MRLTPRPIVRSAFVVLALALTAPARLAAADREARVITPSGSPIYLDPYRATFFDTPAIWVGARNDHSAPVNFELRVWIFGANGKLKGTIDFCTGDQLDRSMRQRVIIPIDIKGVTLQDRAVVTVLRAGSGKSTWALHEGDEEQEVEARAGALRSSGRLGMDRQEAREARPWECPCDCGAVQAACGHRCGDAGLAGFTCTPSMGSLCQASCTCK